MPKVLVTDAQMRNSLAIIRSLGRRGLKVIGAEDTWFATGCFSKYCKGRATYPSPDKHPDEFINYLLNVLKNDKYEVIFPVTDKTVTPIAKHKEEIGKHTLIPLPDYEVLMKAMDKAKTIEIARENGIACPVTFVTDNFAGLAAAGDEVRFPMVIKPRRGFGSRGLTLCNTPEELSSAYPETTAAYGKCLIQEYIPPGGEELGVYALLNYNSELRAVTVHRRLRSYPVSGGPSTLRETIFRPELVDIALRLLKALKWSGVAMVEFKTDPRDNQPKLMEVNPRWWGSLQLSILSGVDFPYLLYRMVTEGDIEPVLDYKPGVKCRWLLPGDILWWLSSGHRLRNLPRFLKFERNDDIISGKDPGPTFGFLLASLRFIFSREMWKFIIKKPIQAK